MSSILAFFRLFRFKWMYSTRTSNLFRCFWGAIFIYSFFCLLAGMLGDSRKGVLYLLGLVISFLAILKDVHGFIVQFCSRTDMIPYRRRSDKKCLIEGWQKIDLDKTGFLVRQVKSGGDSFDFVSYSDELNGSLVDGLEMTFKEEPFRATKSWKTINSSLPEALIILALKLRSNNYRNFRNEAKVSITSEMAPVLKSAQTGSLTLTIAESCYYASYLTNESYRDLLFDEGDVSNLKTRKCDWLPCESDKLNCLLDFNAPKSFRVGVNTLGVTLDGRICIWRQHWGNQSNELMAPTGSGSMDWSDVRHSTGNSFNSAIIYGAERELAEESFDKETKNRLKKSGRHLDTRIIGMYRWGSLGGLPGFILVTKIPLTYADIVLPARRMFGEKGECVKDSAKLSLDISSCMELAYAANGKTENFRKGCAAAVLKFKEDRLTELSVPLDVCLTLFADALEKSESFGSWLLSFLERNQE